MVGTLAKYLRYQRRSDNHAPKHVTWFQIRGLTHQDAQILPIRDYALPERMRIDDGLCKTSEVHCHRNMSAIVSDAVV
jgi:hypothetical protein